MSFLWMGSKLAAWGELQVANVATFSHAFRSHLKVGERVISPKHGWNVRFRGRSLSFEYGLEVIIGTQRSAVLGSF